MIRVYKDRMVLDDGDGDVTEFVLDTAIVTLRKGKVVGARGRDSKEDSEEKEVVL